MNPTRPVLLNSALLSLLSLLAAARLFAADGHAHGDDHAHGDAHSVTIELPAAVDAQWAQINHLAAGLGGHLAAGAHAALASDAANLDALLGELLHAIEKLPGDAQKRATGMHANALRATDALIHAAEDGDAAASEKALKQLSGVLTLLKSSFPKELTAGNQAPTWTSGPHTGRLAPLQDASGTTVAWAELKLHDDKGDLELWLGTDPRLATPFDLPLATVATVAFPKLNKSVTLKVRNSQANEDEDAKPNIRDAKTNYFIFPGDTGADASWLMGATFSSEAKITLGELTTPVFKLIPHTHAAGSDHPH
jgi:hypothetical protein